ncbi:MAG: stage V sporulation protein E [Planctomycetes bacterium]|nr:stage V sporulation protein E [Planctomycetota bacterium]
MSEMNAATRQRHISMVVLCALGLAITGVLIQVAVDSPLAPVPYQRAARQAIYVVAAAVLALGAMLFGYRRAVSLAPWFLYATWALLAVLLIPGMPARGGSVRWIDFGPFNMQPSELAKLALVLFIPYFAEKRGERFRTVRGGLLPALCWVGFTCLLVLLEPDLGQTVLLFILAAALLVVNGVKLQYFLLLILLGIPGLIAFMGDRWDYVRARIEGFLGEGSYQVRQGLIFFAEGGALGTGVGAGRGHLFVPEIHNDFALVAVAEQAGFLGSLCIVALFLGLCWSGFRIAMAATDRAGFTVAFGTSFMIALQAAINISVVTGSVPPKGMSIPFLSFGGSSLLMLGLAVGLLLSVAQTQEEPALSSAPRLAGATP